MLGASFQIARSAMAAYQSAVALTGQNITNVGNPNYARLSGRLAALPGGLTPGGISAGGGVNLAELGRHVDEAVETRLRLALGSRAGAEVTATALGEIEALQNELTQYDLSTQLTQLFNSFSELQTTPGEMTARHLTLSAADAVARTLRYQRAGLLNQAVQINEAVAEGVRQANHLTREIANLNQLIVVQEARGLGFSAPLRDQRDALLRQLAEQMDIEVRAQANGSVNVYVGSEPLVEFDRARGLTVTTVIADGLERATVRFADTQGGVIIRDGRLAAQLTLRDRYLVEQVAGLDALARALIYEVNRVHSTGAGLVGYSQVTSEYAVRDPEAVLNTAAAGLAFPVRNGTFIVHVGQPDGVSITRQIEVDLDGLDGDTTLKSLAAALNQVPGVSATILPDGRLRLAAAEGSEIWFSEDGSGVLAALGVGAFLAGTDAATIEVSAAVRADPRLIAASLSGVASNGDNAGRLALAGQTASRLLNGVSLTDFQTNLVNVVAVRTAAARTNVEAFSVVHSSLLAQREAVSGVSLDEEAINLTKFERAFQGVARYLGLLDNLTAEVLALVR